jgi:inorganic pyrophosphatase
MQSTDFNEFDSVYWQALEALVESNKIIIDRPKGSAHPRYPAMIYPLDYGYLENTKSMDNNEIDIWVGGENNKRINGILCIIDPIKNDSEIKIIYGCSEAEKRIVYRFHNNVMKALMIERKD